MGIVCVGGVAAISSWSESLLVCSSSSGSESLLVSTSIFSRESSKSSNLMSTSSTFQSRWGLHKSKLGSLGDWDIRYLLVEGFSSAILGNLALGISLCPSLFFARYHFLQTSVLQSQVNRVGQLLLAGYFSRGFYLQQLRGLGFFAERYVVSLGFLLWILASEVQRVRGQFVKGLVVRLLCRVCVGIFALVLVHPQLRMGGSFS